MAYFKIYLLTTDTNTDRGTTSFLQTPISEFYSQNQTFNSRQQYLINNNNQWVENNQFAISNQLNTYCFTFNEKLSIHTNGQKDLSFSMTKNVWLDDAWTTNPFINLLHNGSQILLVDKYDNEMLFTIKKIGYVFKKDNITYNFTCQDSFTFQAIRQNDGYTIENDPSSNEYIGAKTIDWWVLNKIKPECHLMYDYVPLFQGLYINNQGELNTFTSATEIRNSKKIIKPIYTKTDHFEFYEKVPFSLSGGNCSSALISLAESLGMSLNYKEHRIPNSNKILRYFWYEPKKHEEVSNLEYSPDSSIQAFGLNQGADSITTVLNVESNTVNEEVISLIPEVPQFFYNIFFEKDWENTTYSNGYFTSICQRKILKATDDSLNNVDFTFNTNIETDTSTILDGKNRYIDGYLYIALRTNNNGKFRLPKYYDKIDFEFDDDVSYVYINEKRYTPKSSVWTIVEWEDGVEINYDNVENTIPAKKQDTEVCLYLRMYVPDLEEGTQSIEQTSILLNFFRDYTEEELEFAEVADKCPWLENKLIDFSYFYNQKILTKIEYQKLLKILQDDLRIQNGRLLLYSKQYYESLHQKTQILANITNDLDSLGAAFNADVINAFATDGSVKDYSYFRNAYNSMIANYYKTSKTVAILNYDELMTDYFNKYFKAQQRFLKNIYSFKQFFESPSAYGNNSTLYRHITRLSYNPTRVADNEDDSYSTIRYISFKEYNLALINASFDKYNPLTYEPYVDIFTANKDKVTFVDRTNMGSYYIPRVLANDMIQSVKYNPKKVYYRLLYKVSKLSYNKTQGMTSILGQTVSLVKHHTDEKYAYYGFLDNDKHILNTYWNQGLKDINSIEIYELSKPDKKFTAERYYHQVGFTEIVSEYLYRKKSDNIISSWFTHDINTSTGVNKWLKRSQSSHWDWIDKTKTSAWRNIFSAEEENNERWSDFWQDGEISSFKDIAKDFYVEKFPITSVEYKGPRYKESEWTWTSWGGSKYDFSYQRANKNNQTISDYIDYWTRTKNGEILTEVKNPSDYEEIQTIPLVTPENESNYYRRVIKAPFWGYAAGAFAGVAGLALGGIAGIWGSIGFGAGLYNIVSNAIWDVSGSIWDTKGHNRKNVIGDTKDSNGNTVSGTYEKTHKGYFDYGDPCRNNENNYITSSNAYDVYLELKNKRKTDFIKTIKEVKYADWNAFKQQREKEPIVNGKINFSKTTIASHANSDGTYSTLTTTNSLQHKDYFDYYQLFGFTYSDICRDGGNLFYKEDYARPLLRTDNINVDWSYSMLIQTIRKFNFLDINLIFKEENENIQQFCEWTDVTPGLMNRMSKVIYYPITSNFVNVDFSILPLKDTEKTMTLEQALVKAKYRNIRQDGYWITAEDEEGNKTTFMIFQNEHFIRKTILPSTYFDTNGVQILPEKRYSLYFGETVYDDAAATIVDFTKKSDLIQGFFEVADRDSGFVRIASNKAKELGLIDSIVWEVEDDEDIDSLTPFYKLENGEYKRAYTIIQAKGFNQSYYYLEALQHTDESFDTNYSFKTKIFLHEDQYDSQNKIIGSNTVEYPDWVTFDQTSGILSITYKDKIYTSNYSINTTIIANLGEMTNGDFWYRYRNKVEYPTLNQHAALIESQLTQYWMQAYSASKYCEFFLPESWQPRSESGTNHFAGSIIEISPVDSNNLEYTTKILHTFIPRVKIYSKGGTSRLPKYKIYYKQTPPITTEDTVLKFINQNNIKKAKDVIQNNIVFDNIFNVLEETYDNFYIEELEATSDITKTTYYYAEQETGIQWNKILSLLSPSAPRFENFNGLYIMQYNILKRSFTNLNLSGYEKALSEHNRVWNQLYREFPGVILEGTYSDSDATTPLDLFVLSSNAFKDMSQPENGYSISVIDVANIMGYSGQEITIGDGIRIKADEFYADADLIKKALSQYLFVTDISYDLRKDSDIQLTVNSIKYQDKLIQRLVKLIK